MAAFTANRFEFGRVIRGVVVAHDFVLRNQGSGPLQIKRVDATAPLVLAGIPEKLPAGTEAAIRASLDTSGLGGAFEGEILVALSDPTLPEARLSFRGEVYPGVELRPAQPLSITGHRGQKKAVSAEIISHEPDPLRILQIEHPKERFTTQLLPIEEGKRYRLTVILNPKGPAGRYSDRIRITTSSKAIPFFEVPVPTELRERVWTTPESLNFGPLNIGFVREAAGLLSRMERRFAIFHAGAPDFQLDLRSDLPFLVLKCQRAGPDRYEASVHLIAENVQVGPIDGFIFIETNDPDCPRLRVPVAGMILDR